MVKKRFPVKSSISLGLVLVALGTGAGVGIRSAVVRADDRAATRAIDAEKPKALQRVRASEEARLHAGGMPIERAMEEVATRGRRGLPAELQPEPSGDLAPLGGWGFQPRDVPPWMLAAADAGH